MSLKIESVNLDFQSREFLDEEKVQEFVSLLRSGKTLPTVIVYSDGQTFWLYDGFHRFEAARVLERKTIHAEVIRGTYDDMEAEWNRVVQAHRGKW